MGKVVPLTKRVPHPSETYVRGLMREMRKKRLLIAIRGDNEMKAEYVRQRAVLKYEIEFAITGQTVIDADAIGKRMTHWYARLKRIGARVLH